MTKHRSIVACKACRRRKVKCDLELPRCARCLKAGLECVGVDPATGREVPRSYLHSLEEKVKSLENMLDERVSFARLVSAAKLKVKRDPLEDEEKAPPAALPSKEQAMEFVRIYFAQSNSQLPVLHRDRFIAQVFCPIYGEWDPSVPLACFTPLSHAADANAHAPLFFLFIIFAISSLAVHMQYPERLSALFKAAAAQHASAFSGPLEQLEAQLLLAIYSLMRPSMPGIWYVLGTALRICVDLGLHNEAPIHAGAAEIDRRRRLFWCTYCLDRQVCFYMGRPVGIADSAVTVPFFLPLDDGDIDRGTQGRPLCKHVALALCRVRQIQLEVHHVLYQNGEVPRRFADLAAWREATEARLERWHAACPAPHATNCGFVTDYFVLNYNHTRLAMNGLLPRTAQLTPQQHAVVGECARAMVACYHRLWRAKNINYTWAVVMNLFMAATLYLYVVYAGAGRPGDEVEEVTEQCCQVLDLLQPLCHAASSCRETFRMLASAVLRARYSIEIDPGSADEPPAAMAQLLNGGGNSNLASLVQLLTEEPADEDVFGLMQLVPLDAIWDQFFAPGEGN